MVDVQCYGIMAVEDEIGRFFNFELDFIISNSGYRRSPIHQIHQAFCATSLLCNFFFFYCMLFHVVFFQL